MKPLPDGSNFDITIRSAGQDRTYRTQKMLADRGSRYLLGKATRVWKAVRLEDGAETGPLVALKDCWVDPSRTREGEILRRIRHNILSASPGDEDLVVRLFPAFEWDGDVLTGDDKSTLDLTCVLSETKTSADVAEDQEQSGSPRPTKAASTAALVHYRLVVSPASDRPVEHETSVSTIYNTLAHAAGGKSYCLSHYLRIYPNLTQSCIIKLLNCCTKQDGYTGISVPVILRWTRNELVWSTSNLLSKSLMKII